LYENIFEIRPNIKGRNFIENKVFAISCGDNTHLPRAGAVVSMLRVLRVMGLANLKSTISVDPGHQYAVIVLSRDKIVVVAIFDQIHSPAHF
jgi:hypothetical protein